MLQAEVVVREEKVVARGGDTVARGGKEGANLERP